MKTPIRLTRNEKYYYELNGLNGRLKLDELS